VYQSIVQPDGGVAVSVAEPLHPTTVAVAVGVEMVGQLTVRVYVASSSQYVLLPLKVAFTITVPTFEIVS
jgi:hypothetical protein